MSAQFHSYTLVNALQFDGTNAAAVAAFCPGAVLEVDALMVPLLGGISAQCFPSSWVVQSADGVFCVMDPDAFAAKYIAGA